VLARGLPAMGSLEGRFYSTMVVVASTSHPFGLWLGREVTNVHARARQGTRSQTLMDLLPHRHNVLR
jgi:hypothetical protein